MAKLELPARAFIEDFVTRAFPNLDWSRGSAVNDAVIKAFSAVMQPLRHEIDVIKVNQSLANWKYMRQSDLDQIASNWGKFRQTGGLSIGTVRIYFNAATDYQFNSLEFYAQDGTTYQLSAPVRIAAADLFTRRLSDGTFYFDVTVQSVGTGSRYALPAGSIVGIRNKPQGIVSVENPTDFSVTAPDESNFDVVNAMYKNLGMRNLVSRQSIRAPILDTFPGVIDIFIAGVGHPNMLRDLVEVQLPTGPVLMHLGGMTDVWLNTTSISKQQTLISYVPSSLEIKIVSAEQAENNELIFAFTRGQFSVDGLFSNPDLASLALDESTSVEFDLAGIPLTTFVLGLVGTDRVQVGTKDLLSGVELLNIVGPAGNTPYVGDLTNLNFQNTDIQAGDVILINGAYRRIVTVSGRLLDLAPALTNVQDYLYVGTPLQPGTRSIALPQIDTLARINDRLILPDTAAAGEYTILGLSSGVAKIGKLVAYGEVTYIGVDGTNPNARVFHYTAQGGTQPLLPPSVGTSHFLYFGTDAGYDQTKYFKILSIIPGVNYSIITVLDPAGLTPSAGTDTSVIQGLAGILPSNSLFSLQRDNGQLFPQAQVQSAAAGHSVYANVVPETVAAGTTVLEALGIGANAAIGDLVEFVGLNIPTALLPQTGGDGSRVTVVISAVTTNSVTFVPSLPFNLPANTPFAVIRNNLLIASAAATDVDNLNLDFTIASMPLGLGDGLGLIVKDQSNNEYVVTSATAGNVRTLQFKAPVSVRTLTFAAGGYTPAISTDVGKPVQQVAGSTSNGVLYDFNNSTRTWRVIPNTGADTFADTSAVNTSVIGGGGAGQLSVAASAPALAGYTNAVSGDLGSLVRQGTYTGVLSAYDNALFQWKVKPLSDADLFDSTTDLTFVDTGGGVPDPAHGQGRLLIPAGPVQIGSGPVTLSLNAPPGFGIGDTVRFFSRFGRNGGMFDGQNFVVSSNPSINATPFAGVVAGTHQLVILTGDNAGIYDISKVGDFWLQPSGGSLVPEFLQLPNAPAAQPIVNATPMTIGTTTFAQTGIGLWGAPGRCVKIIGPGGTRLFAIASINNANSVELEDPGLPFAIYPNSGFTWEIVEALNTPYWVVAAAAKKAYRCFRIPEIGDLLQQSEAGNFTNISGQEHIFTDNTVDFATLFANADFSTGDYELLIDSGSQASSVPIKILSVTGTNSISLGYTFDVTETGVGYHIQRVNAGSKLEDWIEASVVAMSDPKTQLLLSVPNGFDFARYGSRQMFDVTIVPHPAWTPPGGWSFGTDWTMAKFTASYNVGSKTLTLDNTSGHWTFTTGDAFNQANGIRLPAGSKVRVSLRMQDRTSASQVDGSALNTFNYYSDKFFNLPVVKISDVQVLDPNSLQPTRSVPFSLRVDDKGLRYSARETNTLVIEDQSVALLPLAITYITDSSVVAVDNYLNQRDTKVVNANQLAKRMETFSVSITVSVRSTLTANEVASQIASFINSRRSTQPLTKADIIKDLFSNPAISYIDLNTFVMSGTYYKQDGSTQVYPKVEEVFGAETSTYLADNISVTTL